MCLLKYALLDTLVSIENVSIGTFNGHKRKGWCEMAESNAKKPSTPKKKVQKKAAQETPPTVSKSDGDFFDEMIDRAKDTAYTAVGFGVMAVNKTQGLVREVSNGLNSPKSDGEGAGTVSRIADALLSGVRKADHHVEGVITKVEKTVETYEVQLPDQARDLVRKARVTGQETRSKVRAKVLK